MKYRALISFAGKISMFKGEVREIADKELANSLLQPHFIEPVEEVKEVKKPTEEVETKKVNKKHK